MSKQDIKEWFIIFAIIFGMALLVTAVAVHYDGEFKECLAAGYSNFDCKMMLRN